MRENIIIGDLHGVRDEFNLLLDKINYDPNKHRIILVADILDRGNDPIGLLHQVREMNLECVLSNHEFKAYNWRKYELRRQLTGEENPIETPKEERKRQWESLTKEDLNWIGKLPTSINVKDNWYVIHGGLESCKSFADQDPERIIRTRYVDKSGRAVKGKDIEKLPKGSVFWAEMWEGKESIIFGHSRVDKPKIFKNKNNVCIAIDTGCVFGGSLTAYSIERNEFIQVKALRKYY